jgi:hypothetical protein
MTACDTNCVLRVPRISLETKQILFEEFPVAMNNKGIVRSDKLSNSPCINKNA